MYIRDPEKVKWIQNKLILMEIIQIFQKIKN